MKLEELRKVSRTLIYPQIVMEKGIKNLFAILQIFPEQPTNKSIEKQQQYLTIYGYIYI